MHDTLCVRGVQGAGDLANDFNCAFEGHRAVTLNNLFQRTAIEVLHHQKDDAVFSLAKIRDADRVRMRNARGRLGFAREASHHFVVDGQRRAQHFDGHGLVHQHMLAAIDRAHAAAFDQLADFIFSGERLSQQWIADGL